MNILETRRRDLVAGPLVAVAAMALGVKLGKAAGVNPTMTVVTRPNEIPWKPPGNGGVHQYVRRYPRSRTIFRAPPVTSRLHERAGPALRGLVRHMVCREQRGFRS
jgi:hypothetical protein